jgi:hypothetical protein
MHTKTVRKPLVHVAVLSVGVGVRGLTTRQCHVGRS